MLYPQIIQVSQPMTQYWNPWWLGDTHGDLGPMTWGQNLHPIRLDARPLHVRVMPQTWEHHPGNMGKTWENDGRCGKTHYKQSVLNGKLWNIITLNGPNAGIFQPCLKMVASQGSLFAQDHLILLVRGCKRLGKSCSFCSRIWPGMKWRYVRDTRKTRG